MLATYNRISDKIEVATKLENMDVHLVQRLIDTEGWTYTQQYRVKSILNVFFDYAIDHGFIENNSARKAKLPRKNKVCSRLKMQKTNTWNQKNIKQS